MVPAPRALIPGMALVVRIGSDGAKHFTATWIAVVDYSL